MKITPGEAGLGPKPLLVAAANAANSATSAGAPATPTPPSNTPFLKIGTPPGFTALGFESFTSGLTVATPRPFCVPSTERAGGIDSPGLKFEESVQPRFVFSMP